MPIRLGVPELLIVLVIVVIIFGVGRLPEIGAALGKSIKEFRDSTQGEPDKAEKKPESTEPKSNA